MNTIPDGRAEVTASGLAEDCRVTKRPFSPEQATFTPRLPVARRGHWSFGGPNDNLVARNSNSCAIGATHAKGRSVYLVLISVDTPGVTLGLDHLRHILHASAAESDGLQHAYLETSPGSVVFSLYVCADDAPAAARLADQLCRRTMVAAHSGQWRSSPARLAW